MCKSYKSHTPSKIIKTNCEGIIFVIISCQKVLANSNSKTLLLSQTARMSCTMFEKKPSWIFPGDFESVKPARITKHIKEIFLVILHQNVRRQELSDDYFSQSCVSVGGGHMLLIKATALAHPWLSYHQGQASIPIPPLAKSYSCVLGKTKRLSPGQCPEAVNMISYVLSNLFCFESLLGRLAENLFRTLGGWGLVLEFSGYLLSSTAEDTNPCTHDTTRTRGGVCGLAFPSGTSRAPHQKDWERDMICQAVDVR